MGNEKLAGTLPHLSTTYILWSWEQFFSFTVTGHQTWATGSRIKLSSGVQGQGDGEPSLMSDSGTGAAGIFSARTLMQQHFLLASALVQHHFPSGPCCSSIFLISGTVAEQLFSCSGTGVAFFLQPHYGWVSTTLFWQEVQHLFHLTKTQMQYHSHQKRPFFFPTYFTISTNAEEFW